MESSSNSVLKSERQQALEAWLERSNTKLTQVNGQRKYGGPPEVWSGPTPGARCEVFINQIPRDTYEDVLIPLFKTAGPLWEFRLMMNFSGQNRGFAYAKYGSAAVASDAIRMLHNHRLKPGIHLSVRRSTEKRKLCIGDLPVYTKEETLLQMLRKLTEEVQSVSLKPGIDGVSAIVTFSSHYAASMAKKILVEEFKKTYAFTVSVNWQLPLIPSPFNPQQPSESLLSSSPRQILNSPQPSVLPPPQVRPPSTSPGFFSAPQHPQPSCSSTSQERMSAALSVSPMMLLSGVCKMMGVGQPLYQVYQSYCRQDGFICLPFKVRIPGITKAFYGQVMILAAHEDTVMMEAHQAVAEKVLLSLSNMLLSH